MIKRRILIISVIISILVVGIIIFSVTKEPDVLEEPEEKEKIEFIEAYEIGNGLIPRELDFDELEYTVYITDFEYYKQLASYYERPLELTENDFKDKDFVLVTGQYDECGGNIVGIIKTEVEDDTLTVTFGVELRCGVCAPTTYFFLIPVEKGEHPKYKIEEKYYGINALECEPGISYKPLIYLYPEKDMEVTVTLGHPKKLTTTYPKYENNWNVLAKPNGDLVDLKTNRNLYGLYWEGQNTLNNGVQEEGFIVKKEDTISFLEEKLAILGLTEREANEFIIYWLPKLEANNYNYIRFETMEEIDNNMPLEVNPKPDTIIRVMMEYKGLDKPIEVKEQQLETPIRKGFVVVEWGGTELK